MHHIAHLKIINGQLVGYGSLLSPCEFWVIGLSSRRLYSLSYLIGPNFKRLSRVGMSKPLQLDWLVTFRLFVVEGGAHVQASFTFAV